MDAPSIPLDPTLPRSGWPNAPDTRLARAWSRVPVVVRAIVLGFTVLVGGNYLPQGLLAANITYAPSIPWAPLLVAAYLWIYWQYVGGRWWPRSTSRARDELLRATPLPKQVWRWSLLAGALGIGTVTAMTYALAQLTRLGLAFPTSLGRLPLATLLATVAIIAVMAGVVEEAAFRGYMQRALERRYGATTAIAFTGLAFVLAHVSGTAAPARYLPIATYAVGYGVLAYLAGSILPGVVLHVATDVIGFGLLWRAARAATVSPSQSPPGWGSPIFWRYALVTVGLSVATVWAFRGLGQVAGASRGGGASRRPAAPTSPAGRGDSP